MSQSSNRNSIDTILPIIDMPNLTTRTDSFEVTGSDYSLLYLNLHNQYQAQNSISNERMTVKVADLEANAAIVQIKDVVIAHGSGTNTALTISGLCLSEVLSQSPPFQAESIQKSVLSTLNKIDDIMSINKISTYRETLDGKIIFDETRIIYNSKNSDMFTSKASDIIEAQINADLNLGTDIFDKINQEMFNQYPLIQSEHPCKNLALLAPNTLSNVILSRTYSSNPASTETQLIDALKTYGQFNYQSDIIKTLAISIVAGEKYPVVPHNTHYVIDGITYFVTRQDPLKIMHPEMLEKNIYEQEIAGVYSSEYNIIAFTGKPGDHSFAAHFIHEAGHGVLHLLFKNEGKPFSNDAHFEQKTAYEEAELNVFKHLANKLGLNEPDLENLTSINDLIQTIKINTILDLIYLSTHENDVDTMQFSFNLKSKYGFEIDLPAEILDEKITTKLAQEFNTLGITENDFKVLIEFSNLLYCYDEDLLQTELIVRIPQLLAEGTSLSTVETYFKPLMNYWDTTITPEVTKMFEDHQAQCHPDQHHYLPTEMPAYCIEEYIPAF